MLTALADSDPAVRFWAAQALVNLGNQAEPATASLTKTLDDVSPEIAIAAAEALCRLHRTEKALPVLASHLAHADPRVRLASANVLDRLGPQAKPASQAIRKALADERAENFYVRWALSSVSPILKP
jgi:uncharacterized protein HemY